MAARRSGGRVHLRAWAVPGGPRRAAVPLPRRVRGPWPARFRRRRGGRAHLSSGTPRLRSRADSRRSRASWPALVPHACVSECPARPNPDTRKGRPARARAARACTPASARAKQASGEPRPAHSSVALSERPATMAAHARTGRRTGVTRARGGATVSRCVSGRDPVRVSDGPASSAAGVSRAFAEMPASPTSRSPWTEIRRSGSRATLVRRCVAGVGAPTPSCRRRLIRRGPATASSFRSRRHASAHATGGCALSLAAASSLAVVCAASRFGSAGGTRRPVVCVYGRVTRRSPSLDTSLRVMLLDRRRWRRR